MTRILPVLLLCLSGCRTVAYHANGTPWLTTYANATHFEAHSGSDSLVIDGMDHATPTRAAMHGINRITATVAGAAIAIAVPGTGAVPLVTKGAIAVVPSITTPTTPAATPSPKLVKP